MAFSRVFQESQKANAIMDALCATGNWSGESIAKRKDGSTFDIQISASMIEDATGQPVNLVASFIDITKRKQAELALKERETRLKELLNILPLGIFIVDRDGRIIDSNTAFETFMGLTKKELLKREHWKWKYLSPDGTELPPLKENNHDYLPAARPLYDGKPVFDLEMGMVKEDGITIWANANAIPLPFPDWRVVTTIQDISERKRLEKDLQIVKNVFARFLISPLLASNYSARRGS